MRVRTILTTLSVLLVGTCLAAAAAAEDQQSMPAPTAAAEVAAAADGSAVPEGDAAAEETTPPSSEATEALPSYLHDRGPGIPTSMFGTYIRKGELLVYPFFEYYNDSDAEYKPADFGYGTEDIDYTGKFRANEYLLFLGYGLSDKVALELEIAGISATQYKSPDDPTEFPESVHESGLGDVQAQLDWYFRPETEDRPGWFSYAEVVFPHDEEEPLRGSYFEVKIGAGITRGFTWGTLSGRLAAAYSDEEESVEAGEFAIEYLKRVSPSWRLYAGIEGESDEIEAILEAQWHFAPWGFVKLNSAFGVTAKATDWAPEIGVVFSFR
jgi:hypothetical protein